MGFGKGAIGECSRLVLAKGDVADARQFGCRIDFAMCNPPFYSNELEVEQRYKAKELGPFAVRFCLALLFARFA